ncbi:MAG: BspA family leucine-rich repeat surface protein [Bacteroidales bacterium]|nr:BspA family leucine-rich repeat surface protein [Bacteroidales bacterium]
MGKNTTNELVSLNQDWGGNGKDVDGIRNPYVPTTDRKPFSLLQVQRFVKTQLAALSEEKIGYVEYTGGAINFYDKEGGQKIGTINLTGTVYAISMASSVQDSFTVLIPEETKVISITPSTKQGTIGGSMENFPENYSWNIAVDRGNGFEVVKSGTCLAGNSISEDIRPYVVMGTNRIRVTVEGAESEQTKSKIFSCNVTSLNLTVAHGWEKAWKESDNYKITGIMFSGNLQKILHIRIDDSELQHYTQVFPAAVSYITTDFQYDMSGKFPGDTGVHKVEIWMTGEGVETEHISYNIMTVLDSDVATARLIVLNELLPEAVNYENQVLFSYATYGSDEASFAISATDSQGTTTAIDSGVRINLSETKIPYQVRPEVDSDELSGLTVSIVATVDEFSQGATLPMNNRNSYPATAGAHFYMNSSIRSNGTVVNRNKWLNTAPNAEQTEYNAQWTNMAWSNDGWDEDESGVKCLAVKAGSTCKVPQLLPLSGLSGGESLTLEFKLQVRDAADYDTPVLSFMDTDNFSAATTNGIIVFPTKIVVLNNVNRSVVRQSVGFAEDQPVHIMVVFQRNFSNTGRNLCRIYVNGNQQCVFEYSPSASFGTGCCLRLGQASTDVYLYSMRYYKNVVLESQAVLQNFLNTFTDVATSSRSGIRADNNIIDGANVNYDMCKAAGFNTMVLETEGDVPIPSLNRSTGSYSTLTLEYHDNPENNIRITDAPVGGQGTTSMRYYRWNLRWKLEKSSDKPGARNSVWHYADGSTSTKKGWLDGSGNHPQVNKITAKKNVASSTQGHKMGACAMYNELYAKLALNASLPQGAQVAIYQYPFMVFQKHADGSYEFIGLYTVGPDKGDKGTFGYDTSTYPRLLSLEGPNHAPLGTRFIHPWVDAAFDATDETLKFGGEEAWDADCYDDDNITTEAGVLALYEQEWKPAYDLVCFCSPFLASLSEAGYASLTELNADIDNFRASFDLFTNRKNEVATLYDGSYNLIYYRNLTGRYEVLTGHNVVDYLSGYLSNSVNPSTADLIAARKAKFAALAGYYFNLESALYHEDFLMLIAASDNHAKNLYPFKLDTLANGGRWEFRQDDLDTILSTDNNGNNTKDYFVEPGDLNGENVDIFQGSSSVFWTLIRECFSARLKAMMLDMVQGLVELARAKGITQDSTWQTVLRMFSYYFWDSSARYFPILGYNEDAYWTYVYVWQQNPNATYNNVPPLTQALGAQYEAELQFSIRRILYVFSKYEVAGFSGSDSDGLNSLEFTPAQSFTFHLTPAIDLYPSGNRGGGQNLNGGRTPAGTAAEIVATSDGSTTYYIKCLDWLTSLGDLCGLVLTSRGGTTDINFAVRSRRLRTLKVGDETAANVAFNAKSLSINSESLETLDARNVLSLVNPVDLSDCPRLRKALFEGAAVAYVIIPVGAKINELSLPDTLKGLYLQSLPNLADANLVIPSAALASITSIYIRDTPQVDAIGKLRSILAVSGNSLHFITLNIGNVQGQSSDLALLRSLTEPYDSANNTGFGRVEYNPATKAYSNSSAACDLQGSITIPGKAYRSDVLALNAVFTRLAINVSDYYLEIADAVARQIIANNWGDGTGITQAQAEALTSFNVSATSPFAGTAITSLTWLEFFPNVTRFENFLNQPYFDGCNSIVNPGKFHLRITFLRQSLFAGNTSIEEIDASLWDVSGLSLSGSPSTLSVFGSMSALRKLNVSGWDISGWTTLETFFSNMAQLSQIIGLDTWDTSNVTSFRSLFDRGMYYSGVNVDLRGIEGWDTSKVTNFSSMFASIESENPLDLSHWDMSAATTLATMFSRATFPSLDLRNWKLTSAVSLYHMTGEYGTGVHKHHIISSIDVRGWETDGVTNAEWYHSTHSFSGLTSFKCDSGLFNCCVRATDPITSISLSPFVAWTNTSEIDAMLNSLPTLGSGVTRTLVLSSATKAAASASALAAASQKGWTIS